MQFCQINIENQRNVHAHEHYAELPDECRDSIRRFEHRMKDKRAGQGEWTFTVGLVAIALLYI